MIGSLGHAIQSGHFRFALFRGHALQWQFFSGLMIYGNIVGVNYTLQAHAELRQEEDLRQRAEALHTKAELSVLRSQLNPYFLFNTLNSIAALAGAQQVRTMHVIAELAAMLRYTLGQTSTGETVSLQQQLDFTDRYLALEKFRLEDRLRVDQAFTPEALRARLPPLTLQQLVENAVRHGLAPRASGGTLHLCAETQAGALQVTIADDGPCADAGDVRAAAGWASLRCANGSH